VPPHGTGSRLPGGTSVGDLPTFQRQRAVQLIPEKACSAPSRRPLYTELYSHCRTQPTLALNSPPASYDLVRSSSSSSSAYESCAETEPRCQRLPRRAATLSTAMQRHELPRPVDCVLTYVLALLLHVLHVQSAHARALWRAAFSRCEAPTPITALLLFLRPASGLGLTPHCP
jgi:hypothetical protein